MFFAYVQYLLQSVGIGSVSSLVVVAIADSALVSLSVISISVLMRCTLTHNCASHQAEVLRLTDQLKAVRAQAGSLGDRYVYALHFI
jgi:hypothetical protein